MRRTLEAAITAAVCGIACVSQRSVIADDFPRAVTEARRAADGVLLVELWARW